MRLVKTVPMLPSDPSWPSAFAVGMRRKLPKKNQIHARNSFETEQLFCVCHSTTRLGSMEATTKKGATAERVFFNISEHADGKHRGPVSI